MGIVFSLFRRILARLAVPNDKKSIESEAKTIDSKNLVVPRCCTDLKCTSPASIAKERLTKREQSQTQLHNEVVLWKLRFVRGICNEESRQQLYILLKQFSVLNGMLNTIIESETEYVSVTEEKESYDHGEECTEIKELEGLWSKSVAEQKNDSAVIKPDKTERCATKNEKAFNKRKIFFAKVQDRTVKMLSSVLKQVDECRSIIETTCNEHELSENFASMPDNAGVKSLSIFENSVKDQRVHGQKKETIVVVTS